MQDLEKALLAFFYSDKSFVSRFISEGNIDWTNSDYRGLFNIIKKYFIKHGEVATENIIKEESKKKEEALFYVSLITDAKTKKVDPADFPRLMEHFRKRFNVDIVEQMLQKVRLGKEAQRSVELLNEDIYQASNEINKIYRVQTYEEGTMKDTAKSTWEEYLVQEQDPDSIKGKYIGIKEVDQRMNGLRAPDLMLIAGESGTGKSILCMNIAINMWLGQNKIEDFSADYEFKEGGCNILYFSIEMDYENMRQRMDANLADIDFYRLRDRKLFVEEKEKFKKSCIFQSKYGKQFYVTDMPRGITMMDIKAKYEELLPTFTPDVIVVDHMGLMSPVEKRGQDWLEMGDIAADLHEFNRRHNKITLAAVQANRPPKNGKGSHSTNRIGRSEMIPQNASVILQIENREDEHTYSDMPIHITKMRNGEKGKFELYKRFSVMRVCDQDDVM